MPHAPAASSLTSDVNLRRAPEERPENVVTVLPNGAAVEVFGSQGDWLAVRTGALVGYVWSEYVAPFAGAAAWTARVIASGANLRAGPGMNFAAPRAVPGDTLLEVVGFRDGWLAVEQPEGTLWVRARLTAVASPIPAVSGGLPARRTPEGVRTRRDEIEAIADPTARADAYEALQREVPYLSQRDNAARDADGNLVEKSTGTMCNLTSLAMCLTYLGVRNPDVSRQFEDVLEAERVKHGLPPRSDTSGWGGVAHLFGVEVAFVRGGDFTEARAWWFAHVLPVLREGKAVMMSITRHIVRVTGVGAAGLVVDDPFGLDALGSGTTWKVKRTNPYQQPGGTAGADSVWSWADVGKHQMHWLAALSVPKESEGAGALVFAPLPDISDTPESMDEVPGEAEVQPRG